MCRIKQYIFIYLNIKCCMKMLTHCYWTIWGVMVFIIYNSDLSIELATHLNYW